MAGGTRVPRQGDPLVANYSLAELKSQVRSYLSESGVLFFTEDNLAKWITAAHDAISADCPWVVQTTYQRMSIPYVESYLLPEDVIAVKATRLKTASGQPYRLDYIEPAEMDQLKQFGRTSASSTSYRVTYRVSLEGIALELFFPLSARVKMFCDVLKRPAVLTSDSDISEIPSYLAPVISEYALWKAKVKDEEPAQADRAHATFLQGLQDLRSRRMGQQVDQMNHTRGRRSLGRWGGLG